MRLSRKLAEGVGGWLQHEFHCNRSELFSEKYLCLPIGQILSAEFGKKAYAEVEHPILAKAYAGNGKKPQLDFAVLNPHPKMRFAVESKWVGRKTVRPEHVLWDLIRLELLSYHYGTEAVFLLGGRKQSLDAFFHTKAFMATNSRGRLRSILRAPTCLNAPQLRLDQPPPSQIPLFKRVMRRVAEKYPTLEVPSKILNTRPYSFPKDCVSAQYQVYAWEISSAENRISFLPADHRIYKKDRWSAKKREER